jgi:drug/metabolite transporter (DMT)-like permease
MTTGVLLLVLASALMHALWNAILKRMREAESVVIVITGVSALSAIAVALVAWPPVPAMRSLLWTVAAGVLEAVYFVTLARALSRAPLGPVYTTVRGGALVIAWPISVAFLGEHVSRVTILGTMLVTLGLVATGAAERPVDGDGRPPLARSLGWAAICALFVGGYHISYKLALSAGGAPATINALSLSTAFVINASWLGRARAKKALEAARSQPLAVLATGLLASLGFLVFLGAMAHAGAGIVLTLRNTSILFAQVFAAIQGDRPKRLGIVGAILVTAGAVLLFGG